MATQTFFGTLAIIECFSCGVPFGMPQSLKDDRLRDRQSFWCPNGHAQHFIAEREEDRLKRELQAQKDQTAREKHWREQAEARTADVRRQKEHVENRLRGTKSVVTRMKRRTVAGRCPCCSHQFKDLRGHMKTQHPKWNPDRGAEAISAKPEPVKC